MKNVVVGSIGAVMLYVKNVKSKNGLVYAIDQEKDYSAAYLQFNWCVSLTLKYNGIYYTKLYL